MKKHRDGVSAADRLEPVRASQPAHMLAALTKLLGDPCPQLEHTGGDDAFATSAMRWKQGLPPEFPLRVWQLKELEDRYVAIAQRAGWLADYRRLEHEEETLRQRLVVARAVPRVFRIPKGVTTTDVFCLLESCRPSDAALGHLLTMSRETLLVVTRRFPSLWPAAIQRGAWDDDLAFCRQVLKIVWDAEKRNETGGDRTAVRLLQHWLPLGLWMLADKQAADVLEQVTGEAVTVDAYSKARRRIKLRPSKRKADVQVRPGPTLRFSFTRR